MKYRMEMWCTGQWKMLDQAEDKDTGYDEDSDSEDGDIVASTTATNSVGSGRGGSDASRTSLISNVMKYSAG